jgi:hypothetical protein
MESNEKAQAQDNFITDGDMNNRNDERESPCEPDETLQEPETANDEPDTISDKIEEMISALPDSFPRAIPKIKAEIFPLFISCSVPEKEHYLELIRKRTGAASKKAVRLVIKEAMDEMNSGSGEGYSFTEQTEAAKDPKVIEMASQIDNDPQLVRKRIDTVEKLGVVGERRVIGMYFGVMDSRNLPMELGISEALALKNSGEFGGGKSYPMFKCTTLYPKSAYHMVSGGSPKSLYYLQEGLKHKVLVLTEALQLEGENAGDNPLAYGVRTLISEGQLKYQHTTFDDEGNRVTQIRTMEGPTSLITTTVRGRLESQLEDRLITVHPNTTNDQTKEILGQLARKATGADSTPDDSEITAWQLFHESLEVLDVVIPFATGISDFVVTNGELPTSSRRAFKRVLSLIKTTALTYQHQRQRDDLGRVIAEVQDYAMAYQLIDESFRESVRKEKKYYDRRMRILEEKGPITMKDLARIEMVSVPALTQWLEQRLEKGLVTWCDDKGRKFIDERSLEKAKHSGKAFLKVTNPCRLPTPFELTGDDSWKQGQALYQMFDLGLENHEPKLSAIDSELAPGVETQVVCEEKPDGEGVKDLRGEKGEPMNFSNPVFDTHYQKIMDSKAKIDRVLRELEAIPSNYTNERKEEQMPC